jgi:hypothetical protein
VLLAAAARAVLSGDRGDLKAQLEHAYAHWPEQEPAELASQIPPLVSPSSSPRLRRSRWRTASGASPTRAGSTWSSSRARPRRRSRGST